ncbi:ribonuclease III [Sphingomonas sp. KR1UV-12]|uniref:Ribonuclease 3 n=1 Tax=Sphingomonas aurea TaxID=3063994 RepID=A0ABT9EIZ0_9SPHN|nr:ribonuclease III [Sphingomonas sp. KR1UV-12]MDP1026916.1 ribonuclease III [Sphingomonas sp. KR1UV-12]
MTVEPLDDWLARTLGRVPADPAPFARALTHGSHAAEDYQRLEFLGDRVLGLVMAEWLWESFPREAEGQLSKRLNALVTGSVCAEVARELGVRPHLKLGKQALGDGAGDSDNVLGDVMEALIGALYRDAGLDAARTFVRRVWGERVQRHAKAPQHPKSALQEWAAAAGRRAPEYRLLDRSGPGHAPRFTVSVAIGSFASAEATAGNKQEAETAAARALLEKVKS